MIKLFGPDRQLLGYEDDEWAVWVSGLDDVFPQPDPITALVAAATQNAALCGAYDGHPLTPAAYVIVLHHGYAWTPETEHKLGNTCGLPNCADCPGGDDAEVQPTAPDVTRHAVIAAALTAEHYRRAKARIKASPEEHCAAMADAVLRILPAAARTILT